MSNFNNDILVRNIRKLMDEKNINQITLCKELQLKQPNISKAIGANPTRRLTLDQLYDIAEYLNCSLDELVGFKPKKEKRTINTQILAQTLLALEEQFDVKYLELNPLEDIFFPLYEDGEYKGCEHDNVEEQYFALYFPTYKNPFKYAPKENQTEATKEELRDGANYNKTNAIINNFLSSYKAVQEMHSKRILNQDSYEYTVDSLIKNCVIPETDNA